MKTVHSDPKYDREEACENCEFSHPEEWAGLACRRYPPPEIQRREWPRISRDDWCGEWKERS